MNFYFSPFARNQIAQKKTNLHQIQSDLMDEAGASTESDSGQLIT